MAKKPRNITEYKRWLQQEHQLGITTATERHYESVLDIVKSDFQQSEFWRSLEERLKHYQGEYLMETGELLLEPVDLPDLLKKPFESFLEKTFRKNVLNNRHFPDPPGNDWVLPERWYSRVDDTIRTRFIVRYLDGASFLMKRLCEHCATHGLRLNRRWEARQEGYYALHFYVYDNYEIPALYLETQELEIGVELQITTQVQQLISGLLHRLYEQQRNSKASDPTEWQWDYTSEEFSIGYLGHMLHYLEGTIVQIRNRDREGD